MLFTIATSIHAIVTGVIDCFYVLVTVKSEHDNQPKNQEEWTPRQVIGTGMLAFTVCIVICLLPLGGYHGKLACYG